MNDADQPTPTNAKSLQVWLFEMALRSLGTGHATYDDVLARLRRLLATGTPPAQLSEILQRRHASEPLPDTAHGLFDLVNEAIRVGTAQAAARGQVPEATQAVPLVPDLPAEQHGCGDSTLEPARLETAADPSSNRIDETLRDHEHHAREIHALPDLLAARDVTVAELRQALQESDDRLSALQVAHANALSMLDAHTRTGAGLEADLQAALARAATLSVALTASQETLAVHDDLRAQLAALEAEKAHLATILAMRDQALLEAQERSIRDAQTIARIQGEQVEQIAQLRAEVIQHTREAAAQTALLQEARRQIQAFDEEDHAATAMLERARAVPEEHAFMVRRVASGPRGHEEGKARLRATAERLQSVRRATASEAAERTAELIRIDGEETTTYVLAKRTCIGRAPDCELQIDSGSVSRHHAVVIVGPRSTVIEDLNSTNGVRVNGRKVMRHVLGDGDALTIGDTQFRYFARMQEAPLGDSLAELAHTPSPMP